MLTCAACTLDRERHENKCAFCVGEDGAEVVDSGGKQPMDRARSAYIVEGPDGEFACGVRISSFFVPRKSVSQELSIKLPGRFFFNLS